MKYLKKFETSQEYAAFLESEAMVKPNVSYLSDSGKLYYHPYLPMSSFIINQNLTDSAAMISGDINGIGIQLIRQNSHRYLGKYTSDGVMTICQLDDNDSRLYSDGSPADLTGAEGDVFVRLPRFAYKAVEKESNIWEISFLYGDAPDDSWKQWEGNELIGAYKAYVEDGLMYSKSGVVPTQRMTYNDFTKSATDRGNGYTLIRWRHHCIMAFLFYATYGTTDAASILGSGPYGDAWPTGGRDSQGMRDVTGAPTNNRTHFWGLEGWIGQLKELMHDAYLFVSSSVQIKESSPFRYVSRASGTGYIAKIAIGADLDMAPIKYDSTNAYKGNCNPMDTGYYLSRAGSTNYGSMSCLDSSVNETSLSSEVGSRLAFKGSIVESTNVADFKAL